MITIGKQLTPECVTEMKDVRSSLMEDYKITPELVSACDIEIRDYCDAGLHRQGKTIHCLMDLSRPKLGRNNGNQGRQIGNDCRKAVSKILLAFFV